ncbi:hypothetical protein [uncultured Bacteroides sp.]|uniref:hypothetical protein n=1 Tax=uncultured Bacteroides sp. TaxID=162156 RepID=UPI002AAADF9A|nr:hypothetical protein [uncultured Bacteroides sp.]
MGETKRIDKVVFYSTSDMSNGGNLSLAECILNNIISDKIEDINDIIELDQVTRYIDADLYLKKWSREDITLFKSKVQAYKDLIGCFFAKIDSKNILLHYEKLELKYHKAFWRLVNQQKVYKRISAEIFSNIINRSDTLINEILEHKTITTYYKEALRTFLLNYEKTAELLMSIYEEKKDSYEKEMFLPENLTIIDKEDIISRYLDSEKANLNYIRLIQHARNHSNLQVSAKNRLRAKKKTEEGNKKIIETGYTWTDTISVSFSGKQKEIKRYCINENNSYEFSYSYEYIKEHDDNISLFHNFIILFEYLEEQSRINLVSKSRTRDLYEIFGTHSKNGYPINLYFRWRTNLSDLQIAAYNKVLNNIGKRIEDILCDIYKVHFNKKYAFSNAQLTMPSQGSSYLEKVRMIAPEFESILKQYSLFVTEGEIDTELLQITSSPCVISKVPSLVPKKYIYINSDCNKARHAQYSLFSDQSGLSNIEPFKDKYHCLFDLLIKEEVNFDDFKDYQKIAIQDLINNKMLSVDKKNIVRLENPEKVAILKDLFENEVACYWYYPTSFQQAANEMESQEMLYFESSLFTKQECSFFNYHLNKAEFTNGLDLRNSYLHGTQASFDKEQTHMISYFTYLKLCTLVLFKIENDLSISTVLKQLNIDG